MEHISYTIRRILQILIMSMGAIFLSLTPVFAEVGDGFKPSPTSAVFSDIKLGYPHYVAIKFLKERRVLAGYPDGSFKPKRFVSRAEALKILASTLDKAEIKAPEPTMSFPDLHKEDWFYEFAYKALQKGIIQGYPDGFFHPERPINRAESLKIILLEESVMIPEKVMVGPYSDVPVESWFAPYAKISRQRGLFVETRDNGGQLLPNEPVTRGEFAELLYHLLKSSNQSKFTRATYYSDFLAGRGTSSGDPYHPGVYTTAHRTLPFGTKILVTNLLNGESVEVKVNDRGPYATGIDLDLSKSAFASIAKPSSGIIPVEYKIIP